MKKKGKFDKKIFFISLLIGVIFFGMFFLAAKTNGFDPFWIEEIIIWGIIFSAGIIYCIYILSVLYKDYTKTFYLTACEEYDDKVRAMKEYKIKFQKFWMNVCKFGAKIFGFSTILSSIASITIKFELTIVSASIWGMCILLTIGFVCAYFVFRKKYKRSINDVKT